MWHGSARWVYSETMNRIESINIGVFPASHRSTCSTSYYRLHSTSHAAVSSLSTSPRPSRYLSLVQRRSSPRPALSLAGRNGGTRSPIQVHKRHQGARGDSAPVRTLTD